MFEAIFIVSTLIKEVADSVKAFQIELVKDLSEQISQKYKFEKNEHEEYVLVKNLKAYDVYSARNMAERKLDRLSDLYTLFYHKKKISWRTGAIISQCCCKKDSVLVVPAKGPMEKGFDLNPQEASSELNRLIKDFSARGLSFEKFNRVADLHGICVSNDIEENQLVTLWTSLETLVPSNIDSAKISGMSAAVMPFILLGYIKRIIERFTADLFLWDKGKTRQILHKVPNCKGRTIYRRTLNLLAVAGNKDIRNELYQGLADFYLLRHRAFQLSEILQDPKKIKDILKTHEKKVEWQIRRIYRTRNLIVHASSTPSFIHTLIENGHDYLDQVLLDTMNMSCGEYRVKTLKQAFEIARVRYQKFERLLSNVDVFDEASTVFLLET